MTMDLFYYWIFNCCETNGVYNHYRKCVFSLSNSMKIATQIGEHSCKMWSCKNRFTFNFSVTHVIKFNENSYPNWRALLQDVDNLQSCKNQFTFNFSVTHVRSSFFCSWGWRQYILSTPGTLGSYSGQWYFVYSLDFLVSHVCTIFLKHLRKDFKLQ